MNHDRPTVVRQDGREKGSSARYLHIDDTLG